MPFGQSSFQITYGTMGKRSRGARVLRARGPKPAQRFENRMPVGPFGLRGLGWVLVA